MTNTCTSHICNEHCSHDMCTEVTCWYHANVGIFPHSHVIIATIICISCFNTFCRWSSTPFLFNCSEMPKKPQIINASSASQVKVPNKMFPTSHTELIVNMKKSLCGSIAKYILINKQWHFCGAQDGFTYIEMFQVDHSLLIWWLRLGRSGVSHSMHK